MGDHARIGPGDQVTINTSAWLEQRTGGVFEDYTTDLHTWAATHDNAIHHEAIHHEAIHDDAIPGGGVHDEAIHGGATLDGADIGGSARQPTGGDWFLAARAWCRARGYDCGECDFLIRVGTRLDTERLWVSRAVVDRHVRIAVVGINHDRPQVYADTCRDTGTWFDADSVDISCPDGHGWTWRTGRELLTRDGDWTTLTLVFGPSLDAPFTGCGDCAAYRQGEREQPCPCDGHRGSSAPPAATAATWN